MNKTIDTLVEDIYDLFTSDNKNNIEEEDLKNLVDGISHAVVSALSKRDRKSYLRLSMIGHPSRKIWYELNEAPKQKLSGPTFIKFLYGDILEQLLILLTKTAGHTSSKMYRKWRGRSRCGPIKGCKIHR